MTVRGSAAVVLLAAVATVSCSYTSVAAGGSGPLPGFECAPLPKALYPAADAAIRYMTAKVLVARKDRPPIFLAVCSSEPPEEIIRSVQGVGILPISRADLYDTPPAPKVVIDRDSGANGVLVNILGFRCTTEGACKFEVVYGAKHSILDLERSGDDDWSVGEDSLQPSLVRSSAAAGDRPA